MTILTLREAPPERLDLSRLTPRALAGLSERDMAQVPVGTSRFGLTLGDCFTVTAGEPDTLVIAGGSSRLDGVGAGLDGGTIRVEGDVGQRLGAGMRAGTVSVAGNAGPFAGCGATCGRITIAGDAAEAAGGAPQDQRAGLDGATLVIKGRAGDRLGDRMRGGLIIANAAGDHAGARMVAGTIVAERCGDFPGYGMKRGTLLVGHCGAILPSFVATGRHDLVMLRLLAKALQHVAPEMAALARADLARWSGDLASLGKGELLCTHS
jgi:formylmethanofuran dehydrogenase subunit C